MLVHWDFNLTEEFTGGQRCLNASLCPQPPPPLSLTGPSSGGDPTCKPAWQITPVKVTCIVYLWHSLDPELYRRSFVTSPNLSLAWHPGTPQNWKDFITWHNVLTIARMTCSCDDLGRNSNVSTGLYNILRGEKLNYKVVQNGCYRRLLTITSWAPLLPWVWSFTMLVPLKVSSTFKSHDHIWKVTWPEYKTL